MTDDVAVGAGAGGLVSISGKAGRTGTVIFCSQLRLVSSVASRPGSGRSALGLSGSVVEAAASTAPSAAGICNISLARTEQP